MDRMDYFFELYCPLPRNGPGDDLSTRKAFEMIEDLPPEPRFLDIGCGPGVQTLELLRISRGTVVALDLLPRVLKRVQRAAEAAGFADRLETVQADMNEMAFEPASFDLIWSEGALYIMGFAEGLAKVREFVKPGGYVAVSEAVWLKADPPQEAVDLWREYPAIDNVDKKLEVIREADYETVGHFILPATSWTDLYYDPLEERVAQYAQRWQGIPQAEEVLAEARREVSVFKQYPDCYSYAFFVMRK